MLITAQYLAKFVSKLKLENCPDKVHDHVVVLVDVVQTRRVQVFRSSLNRWENPNNVKLQFPILGVPLRVLKLR